MKNLRIIRTLIIFLSVLLIGLLVGLNISDNQTLSKKLSHHQKLADSLRQAIAIIDASVKHKDSILLVYLSSLDKTLEELNKESLKNRLAIQSNFAKQDSIRRAFCREMKVLDQDPSECQ